MLKNTITNQILIIDRVCLNNNSCEVAILADEFAETKTLLSVNVPSLYTRIANVLADNDKTIYDNIVYQCELGILELPEYSDWVENDVVHWEEEDWYQRVIMNYTLASLVAYTNPDFIVELRTAPVNPIKDKSEVKVIYMNYQGLNPIPSEIVDYLIYIGAKIETKSI